MEDRTEEEFKSCLLKSFINELDETIELEVSSSDCNLQIAMGNFSENVLTDSDEINISNKSNLLSALFSIKKSCISRKNLQMNLKLRYYWNH